MGRGELGRKVWQRSPSLAVSSLLSGPTAQRLFDVILPLTSRFVAGKIIIMSLI